MKYHVANEIVTKIPNADLCELDIFEEGNHMTQTENACAEQLNLLLVECAKIFGIEIPSKLRTIFYRFFI